MMSNTQHEHVCSMKCLACHTVQTFSTGRAGRFYVLATKRQVAAGLKKELFIGDDIMASGVFRKLPAKA